MKFAGGGHIHSTALNEGSPGILKSSVLTLLCRPDLTVGTAVTDLGK